MEELVRKIEVVPYNVNWPTFFEEEAQRIFLAMGECVVKMHHIGSTAVPLLPAKPIIDIMPEVESICAVDQFDDAMKYLGYFPKGEFGIPGRRFYLKGQIDRTHHVHVFESGSEGLIRHLAVRDYLRCHPGEAEAYATLKMKLAEEFPRDNDSYCAGKHDYVQQLERRALSWTNLEYKHE